MQSQEPMANPLEKLCVFINNHSTFSLSLNQLVESWSSTVEDESLVDKIYDKVESTLINFQENSAAGVEIFVTVYNAEIRNILKNGLFRNNWDDSITVIKELQTFVTNRTAFINQNISPSIMDSIVIRRTIIIEGCSTVINTYIECLLLTIINYYNSNSNAKDTLTTALQSVRGAVILSLSVNVINRLNEDLELITKIFETVKNAIIISDSEEDLASALNTTHTIDQNKYEKKNNKRNKRLKSVMSKHLSKLSYNSKRNNSSNNSNNQNSIDDDDDDMSVMTATTTGNKSYRNLPPKVAFNANLSNLCDDDESISNATTNAVNSASTNIKSAAWSNVEKNALRQQYTKLFESLLIPLKDLVIATQMKSAYLVDFVKSELFRDFGKECAVKVWNLLMIWRNESKAEIAKIFQEQLLAWYSANSIANTISPSSLDSNNGTPLMDLNSIIGKFKLTVS